MASAPADALTPTTTATASPEKPAPAAAPTPTTVPMASSEKEATPDAALTPTTAPATSSEKEAAPVSDLTPTTAATASSEKEAAPAAALTPTASASSEKDVPPAAAAAPTATADAPATCTFDKMIIEEIPCKVVHEDDKIKADKKAASGDASLDQVIDYSTAFSTQEVFPSKESLIEWAKKTGKELGFEIVTLRSEQAHLGRRPYIILGCERAEKRRKKPKTKISEAELKQKGTGTKKCGCPFELRGYSLEKDVKWVCRVVCGHHKHIEDEHSEGHSSISSDQMIDCSTAFSTKEVFPSRECLIEWAKKTGKELGFVIVTVRSEQGRPGRKPYIILGCERGGKYRKNPKTKISKTELKRKGVGTKKCGCPFELKGVPLEKNEKWICSIVRGHHNHMGAKHFEGHSYAGRLSTEEKNVIVELTKNMAKPKDILLALKCHDHKNDSTIKTIYNARHKLKREGKVQQDQLVEASCNSNFDLETYLESKGLQLPTSPFASSSSSLVTSPEEEAALAVAPTAHDAPTISDKIISKETHCKIKADTQGCGDASLDQVVDCTDAFSTKEVFPSRESLFEWTKKTGKELGFVVVTARSEQGRPRRKPYMILGCERGGKHRSPKNRISEAKRKGTGSKKCGCPFELKAVPLKKNEKWICSVVCGHHNHFGSRPSEGHSYAGRLSMEEINMIAELTMKMVKPKDILLALKFNDHKNESTLKSIYNAQHKLKRMGALNGQETQLLMAEEHCRSDDGDVGCHTD